MKSTHIRRLTLSLAFLALPGSPYAGNESMPAASVWAESQQAELASNLLNGDQEALYRAVHIAERLGPDRTSDDLRVAFIALLNQIYDKYEAAGLQGIAHNEVVGVEFTASLIELVSSLNDLRSIPVLVRSGNFGHSRYAAERLASFGEQSLPQILKVLGDADSSNEVVGFNLGALTMMVQAKGVQNLSEGAREEMVRAAKEGLKGNGIYPLGDAVDLAGALNDPVLNEMLFELQQDTGELEGRGLSPRSVGLVRKAVAEALAEQAQ